MSTPPQHRDAPPANKGLLAIAVVCLSLPIIALMLVGTYAKDGPRFLDFPFFIWYQFLWVALCSILTYTAYRLVLKARPHRPMNPEGTEFLTDAADEPNGAANDGEAGR
ncbi:hypothetical protein BA895_03005 [Humibacillus sp. DSM 29435]|uniref:DUF3311 domain-containing protein n=1 Tax=Humibacillus sp. DSM 29435 TaxID=1869167 RepID=UPI0008724FFE|nr:DUF3311 domain-containing protein [Humibacillus sp. DSM 29435]OFE16572.1 hypothetical protein BA895_03005 [Humibacillus sp. DSM 29435]